MRALLAVLALAACVGTEPGPTQPPVVPDDGGPGYPPKMGDVAGQLGGQAVAWETFDFSIGAFDASAWVEHFDGPYRLHLNGYPPGDPASQANRLSVTGSFAGRPATGSLRGVEVIIGDSGPFVASQTALVVERIDVPDGSGYGSASGRITANICPSNPAMMAPCRQFEVRFDTKVQFNG